MGHAALLIAILQFRVCAIVVGCSKSSLDALQITYKYCTQTQIVFAIVDGCFKFKSRLDQLADSLSPIWPYLMQASTSCLTSSFLLWFSFTSLVFPSLRKKKVKVITSHMKESESKMKTQGVSPTDSSWSWDLSIPSVFHLSFLDKIKSESEQCSLNTLFMKESEKKTLRDPPFPWTWWIIFMSCSNTTQHREPIWTVQRPLSWRMN